MLAKALSCAVVGGDFAACNDVYGEVFPSEPPARITVQVGLVLSRFVEVEAIAVRP